MFNEFMEPEEKHIHGVSASPGIAIGRAFLLRKREAVAMGISLESEADITGEIEKFDNAVRVAVEELESVKARMAATLNREETDMLDAQLEMLADPQIREDVVEKIRGSRMNAHDALIEVTRSIVEVFNNMEDDYMRARSVDVQDTGNRLLSHLSSHPKQVFKEFEEDIILIAADLSASDTLTMDITHIAGLATQMGGKTSHAAIIAKSRGNTSRCRMRGTAGTR